jgi:hypothetical protein
VHGSLECLAVVCGSRCKCLSSCPASRHNATPILQHWHFFETGKSKLQKIWKKWKLTGHVLFYSAKSSFIFHLPAHHKIGTGTYNLLADFNKITTKTGSFATRRLLQDGFRKWGSASGDCAKTARLLLFWWYRPITCKLLFQFCGMWVDERWKIILHGRITHFRWVFIYFRFFATCSEKWPMLNRPHALCLGAGTHHNVKNKK